VDVHDEVLDLFELGLAVVVVGEQFADLGLFCLFEGDVVGVPAEDVFELALEFVDVFVVLS